MLPAQQGEGRMARGMFRMADGWVQVDYEGKSSIPVSREYYVERGYLPPYEKLPTEEEYKAKNPPPVADGQN